MLCVMLYSIIEFDTLLFQTNMARPDTYPATDVNVVNDVTAVGMDIDGEEEDWFGETGEPILVKAVSEEEGLDQIQIEDYVESFTGSEFSWADNDSDFNLEVNNIIQTLDEEQKLLQETTTGNQAADFGEASTAPLDLDDEDGQSTVSLKRSSHDDEVSTESLGTVQSSRGYMSSPENWKQPGVKCTKHGKTVMASTVDVSRALICASWNLQQNATSWPGVRDETENCINEDNSLALQIFVCERYCIVYFFLGFYVVL